MILEDRSAKIGIERFYRATLRCLNDVFHFHGIHDGHLLPFIDFVTLFNEPLNDGSLQWRPDREHA